jgi:hypothetical protein
MGDVRLPAWWALLDPTGTIPISQILVCILAGALATALPALRRPGGFLSLSLVGTAVVYRQAAVGFALTNAAVFLFIRVLGRECITTPD